MIKVLTAEPRSKKKGVGTRRLKYRLPENPGILNSPHTSVGETDWSRAIHMSIIVDDPSHDLSHISQGSRW